ncbi:MAG TPA: sensor histidine kinase [Terriglobales bacterium]|nr:sensor histidine kinase [Terriglobales bacterium]
MSLLPKNRDHGWAPYTWLIFLSFFFFQPILDKRTTGRDWLITVSATIVFLVLYFALFRLGKPWNYLLLACMAAMGLGLGQINVGSSVFIIFTAVFLPWVVGNMKAVFAGLAVLNLLIAADAYFFHPDVGFWATSMVVSLGVGLSNGYFAEKVRADQKLRMAHEEIEHLAKVAERERIARDLHDVLGHTLTLIAVKSTLAGRLIEKDPKRAKAEVADIERVSRDAMAEIRNTLGGYRSYKLSEELQRAKSALESAGVAVKTESAEVHLTPAQESVAALIMREAVTNVVRHAHAGTCRLLLARNNGNCVLEVQDDGRGGLNSQGNGLRGMRERIEALGGTLTYETSMGTSLKFEFPLNAPTVEQD